MKTKLTCIARTFLILFLIFIFRFVIYDAIYGFDDQKSYRAEVIECHLLIRLFPKGAETHYRLAKLLSSNINDCTQPQERLSESIREYTKAVQLDPNNEMAYFDLARLYETQFNDYQTANALYQKCVLLNPTSFVTQGFLAESYRQIGQLEKAKYHKYLSDQLTRVETVR